MITYVDTSVVIKLLVDELGSDDASLMWREADTLVAARLLYVETVATLTRACRGGRITPSGLASALEEFHSLWRQLAAVEITAELIKHAAEVAASDALRGYDAVHLAAALGAGADIMASADDELCAAAARHELLVARVG